MSWMDGGGFVMNLLPHRRHLDGGGIVRTGRAVSR